MILHHDEALSYHFALLNTYLVKINIIFIVCYDIGYVYPKTIIHSQHGVIADKRGAGQKFTKTAVQKFEMQKVLLKHLQNYTLVMILMFQLTLMQTKLQKRKLYFAALLYIIWHILTPILLHQCFL